MFRICLALVLTACGSETGLGAELDPGLGLEYPPSPDLTPAEHEDVFAQILAEKADVLFVVDNSGSMRDEQARLGDNFPRFLDALLASGADFHIGVVSTDMYDPRHAGSLRPAGGERWLAPESERPEVRFANMVDLGIDGANDERGRAAVYTALELRAEERNAGFLREDADLHVMVFSDEEDESGGAPVSQGEFVDYLKSLKAPPHRVTFSSVVGPEDPPPFCNAEHGTEYLGVTRSVGGFVGSICDEDWAPLLDELGLLASGLLRVFPLSETPIVASLRVQLEADLGVEDLPPEAWAYDAGGNTVALEEAPAPGSLIRVRYRVAE